MNFKDRMADFANEFVDWMRLLASTTRAGGAKYMLPEPISSMEILKSLMPSAGRTDQDDLQEFIESRLRPLRPQERPASRQAINNMYASIAHPGVPFTEVDGQIQLLMRTKLLAPAKVWQARIGGTQQPKTPVYKYRDSNQTDAIATLKAHDELVAQ